MITKPPDHNNECCSQERQECLMDCSVCYNLKPKHETPNLQHPLCNVAGAVLGSCHVVGTKLLGFRFHNVQDGPQRRAGLLGWRSSVSLWFRGPNVPLHSGFSPGVGINRSQIRASEFCTHTDYGQYTSQQMGFWLFVQNRSKLCLFGGLVSPLDGRADNCGPPCGLAYLSDRGDEAATTSEAGSLPHLRL